MQLHGVYPSAMRTGLTSPAIIRPQPFSYSDAHEICSSHLVDRITSKQYEENVPRSLLSTQLYCVERSPSFPKDYIVLSFSIRSKQDCEVMNS